MADTVAIQGEAGSFSHAAALETHGDVIRLMPCVTFVELFRAVQGGGREGRRADREHARWIGARELRSVERARPACGRRDRAAHPSLPDRGPRTRLPDVHRVASHPVALAQCRRFFTTHPDLVAVPAYDTAGSVRDLMAGK